ncbi:META domain-containing protein [Qipengyuania flava]|nr:META domain-containing protein [Qipengyuania flava]
MKRRGQHHRGLAWLVAGGLGIGAATVLSSLFLPHESLWHALAAPQEDGTWQFTTIDDRDVRADGYSVRIHWRKVIAGYDGCNNWGTSDGNVLDNGERIITIDLQECASQPTDEAYWQLTRATATMTLKGSRLILHDELHRGELRRGEAR